MEFLTEGKSVGLIIELMIKSTSILIACFILVLLFRKKSATLRHFLLSLSLLSLLLLPVFSTFNTGWETRLLPSWTNAQNILHSAHALADDLELLTSNGIQDPDPASDQGPLLSAVTETEGELELGAARPFRQKNSAELLVVAMWTAGLLFLTARIFLGLYGAFKLTRQGKVVNSLTWRQLLLHFLQAVTIKRNISLLSHNHVKVPLTWGVFKPVVIVPEGSKNWTREECSSALFHELSHIKRGDFLIKILARLSCAIYWFNPFSWFALHMMKKEQEKACDELVLKAGVRPSTYAVNLLSIKQAGRMSWNPPSAALGAVGKSHLSERLVAILKQQFSPKEVKMKTKILLSSLVITIIVLIGLARPSTSAAQSEQGLVHAEKILAYEQPSFPDVTVQNDQQKKEKKAEEQKKKEAEKTEKEKSDEKSEQKKTISWVTKDGKTIDIYITTDEDDEAKVVKVIGTMEIDIDEDSDKRVIKLHLPGEKLVLKKNEEGEWTIEADNLALSHLSFYPALKLSQTIALQNKLKCAIKIDKGEYEKSICIVKKPHLELGKTLKFDMCYLRPGLKLHLSPHNKVLALPHLALPHLKNLALPHLQSDSQEIEKKLQEIREKLKQIKEKREIDQEEREKLIDEIEAKLKELSEKLKTKKKELKDVAISVSGDHIELDDLKDIKVSTCTATEKIEDLKEKIECLDSVVVSVHPDVKVIDFDDIKIMKKTEGEYATIDIKKGKRVVAIVDEGEGELQIIIKADLDEENRVQYEEAIANIKNRLPESYSIESEIDEDKGKITIKITGVTGDKDTKISIKQLMKDIKEELSHIK